MTKRRNLPSMLLALLVSILCTFVAHTFLSRSPKWTIDFNKSDMAYMPLVEDSNHVWLASAYSLQNWDAPSLGIDKQLVIIDTASGKIKHSLELDHQQNLESVSPCRPVPIIIDGVLFRFTFYRDAVYQYCDLRTWDFIKSSQEQVLQTWKSALGLPMSAVFGTPREGSCPFIVQTGVHFPFPVFLGSDATLLSSLCTYFAWNASTVSDVSVLPLPGEELLSPHLAKVHSCMLDASNKKVMQRSSWYLPLFHWCWSPMIDPLGNWIMYGNFISKSEKREPLVYRCQDGRQLPFVNYPGHYDYSGMVHGMIHLGGDYLYKVMADRVEVIKVADITLINAKEKRQFIGNDTAFFEFDNARDAMRVYENDPGSVASTISYLDSDFYSGLPFLANDRFVYSWGTADTRPQFIRNSASKLPIIDRVWPKSIEGVILQVDIVASSTSIIGSSLYPTLNSVNSNNLYAFKYEVEGKKKILRQLQCWDATQREVKISEYIAVAILSFALTLFAVSFVKKRLNTIQQAPIDTSVDEVATIITPLSPSGKEADA